MSLCKGQWEKIVSVLDLYGGHFQSKLAKIENMSSTFWPCFYIRPAFLHMHKSRLINCYPSKNKCSCIIVFFQNNDLVLIFSRDLDLKLTPPHREKTRCIGFLASGKRIPNSDNMQMSVQTLYGECADVLNVLINSVTATHVFLLILSTWGGVVIQYAASLVSHMC